MRRKTKRPAPSVSADRSENRVDDDDAHVESDADRSGAHAKVEAIAPDDEDENEQAWFTTFERGDHAELAEALVCYLGAQIFEPRAKLPLDRVVGDQGAIWTYNDAEGIWHKREHEELLDRVVAFAGCSVAYGNGSRPLKVSASSAEGAVKLARAITAKPGYFSQAAMGVAFTNGFVRVVGGRIELMPHSRDHRARHRHAFPYDADAPAKELHKFLRDVFSDCTEPERNTRIAFLQEHAGACLAGIAPVYQKCALLVGPGGNGKSKACEILYRGALPDDTTVSLPPQLWGERFQVVRLLGALANVCDEMPESDVIRTGVFKSVIAGEPLHLERKHRDSFEARVSCGHVFAANQLPITKDLTEGFFRRFVAVNFEVRIHGTSKDDPEIAEKVIAACRPGIVAWALKGAARLQRNGRYTIPASSADTLQDWRRTSDSVAVFVDECTRPLSKGSPANHGKKASAAYAAYKDWAREHGYQCVNWRTFGHRLKSLGLGAQRQGAGCFHPFRIIDPDEKVNGIFTTATTRLPRRGRSGEGE